jgi:hypothetical protein
MAAQQVASTGLPVGATLLLELQVRAASGEFAVICQPSSAHHRIEARSPAVPSRQAYAVLQEKAGAHRAAQWLRG